jgi:hypothetical protein
VTALLKAVKQIDFLHERYKCFMGSNPEATFWTFLSVSHLLKSKHEEKMIKDKNVCF